MFRKTLFTFRKTLFLTAKIGGSKLRSIGFMMMKTCWFLWVRPVSSLSAALQKYCTQPCLPKKVEGRPRGRPNLNGKLWIPADRRTDSPPRKIKDFEKILIVNNKVMAEFSWLGQGEI